MTAPGGARASRVAGNSGWNLAAFGTGVAVNLVTLPIVVRRVGIDEFGVAGVAVALVAPFLLVGTVLGQAAAQRVAQHGAQGDWDGAREALASVFALLATAVPLGVVVLVLAAPSVARALLGEADASALDALFLVAALGWAAQQGSGVLQGVHVGCEAYRRIALVSMLAAIGGGAAIVAAVWRLPSATGYVAGLAASYWIAFALWAASAWREYRHCLAAPRFHRGRIAGLLSFSGWQTSAQLTAVLAAQADRYLLGAYVRAQSVGFYNVAQRLEEVAYIGVLKAGEVLFPFFSATAQDAPARVADRYFRASWLLNLLAAVMLAPLLPWAHDILALWIDAQTAGPAAPVLRILAVGGLVGCTSNVFSFFALGTGRTRHLAALSAVTSVVSIAVSLVLLPLFGLAAAGAGALAGMLAQFAVVTVLTRRIFGEHASAARILHASVSPVLAGLAVAAGLMAAPLPEADGWWSLLAALAATAALVAAAILAVAGASPAGRTSLADLTGLAGRLARRHA